MGKQFTANLTLRIPAALRTKLEAIARDEANNVNAVARRLLASGVAREERNPDEASPRGEAA